MDVSSYIKSVSAMVPDSLKGLWNEGTFKSLLLALPTVLTSGLFMTFGLLNVFLACVKWVLFLIIIATTFFLGLLLFFFAVGVLVAGAMIGLGIKYDGAKAGEKVVQGSGAEEEAKKSRRRVVRRTASGIAPEEAEKAGKEVKGE